MRWNRYFDMGVQIVYNLVVSAELADKYVVYKPATAGSGS